MGQNRESSRRNSTGHAAANRMSQRTKGPHKARKPPGPTGGETGQIAMGADDFGPRP